MTAKTKRNAKRNVKRVMPEGFDRKVLDKWLKNGLCSGAGDGVNAVCVEQAIALAFGMELTDKPELDEKSCIARCVAEFKRNLNDCNWSSPSARSKGLRRLAYEQIGSKGIDCKFFAKRLAELTIRELLPPLFRIVAEMHDEPHKARMKEAADRCENDGDELAADAAAAAADGDKFLTIMAGLGLRVLHEAKKKAGIPLFAELS